MILSDNDSNRTLYFDPQRDETPVRPLFSRAGRFFIIVFFTTFILSGCTVRELRIEPVDTSGRPIPNAEVYINHIYRGRSPLRATFEDYGDYFIEIRARGFQTFKRRVPLHVNWYGWEPLRLVMDLMPFTVRDIRNLRLKLIPRTSLTRKEQDRIANHVIRKARDHREMTDREYDQALKDGLIQPDRK